MKMVSKFVFSGLVMLLALGILLSAQLLSPTDAVQPAECTGVDADTYGVRRHSFVARRAKLAAQESVLILGDSHLDTLPVEVAIQEQALNASIGGQTAFEVEQRLPDFSPLRKWKTIYLLVGFNDLRCRDSIEVTDSLSRLADELHAESQIVFIEIPELHEDLTAERHSGKNVAIRAINQHLQALADTYDSVHAVVYNEQLKTDDATASAAYYEADGVHLNEAGRLILLDAILEMHQSLN